LEGAGRAGKRNVDCQRGKGKIGKRSKGVARNAGETRMKTLVNYTLLEIMEDAVERAKKSWLLALEAKEASRVLAEKTEAQCYIAYDAAKNALRIAREAAAAQEKPE
jgi:hypothetical protein